MPGKLKAKIVAGRHLPVMDRASDLTDAFVEVSEASRARLSNHSAICNSIYFTFSFRLVHHHCSE